MADLSDVRETRSGRRTITRRQFLTVATLLSGSLVAGTLQGCGPSTPAASPTSAPVPTKAPSAPAPAAQPTAAPKPAAAPTTAAVAAPTAAQAALPGKRGGILRVGAEETPTQWDMHGSGLGYVFIMNAPVFNTLVTQDPSDPNGEKLMPDLAKEWTVSPDGQSYTFTLREGVKWHDGARFSSADVISTMNKIISPPQGVLSARKELFASVASVDAPNERTVVFKLKFPDAAFLEILAIAWNVIYPKHITDKFGPKMWDNAGIENKIGTGAFKYVDFKLNQYVKLERNPNYFKPGLPYLDGIELRYIPEPAARAVALISNNLDLFSTYCRLQGEEAQVIAQQKPRDITIGRTPLLSPIVMYTNTAKPPFNNLKARQALSEALDRKALTEVLLEGGATGGLVLPGSRWDLAKEEFEKLPGYGSSMPARLARARQLLTEAGHSADKPLVVNLVTRPSPDSERMGTFAAPMIQAIGNLVTVLSRKRAGTYPNSGAPGAFSAGVPAHGRLRCPFRALGAVGNGPHAGHRDRIRRSRPACMFVILAKGALSRCSALDLAPDGASGRPGRPISPGNNSKNPSRVYAKGQW